MSIINDEKPPRPWSVQAARGVAGEEILRIGHRQLRLGDVVGYRSSTVAELNYQGHMVAVAVFMIAGCAFGIPVAGAILAPRFMVGAVLFMAIGLALVADIWQGHSMIVHRVALDMADGSTEVFASPNAAEVRALAALLAAKLGPARPLAA